LIFSQSALSGRDDRAGDPVAVCDGRAGRDDADTLLTAVAELPITTVAIAVAVSTRLRTRSAVRRF
jgi:hypothetical protein